MGIVSDKAKTLQQDKKGDSITGIISRTLRGDCKQA